LDEFKRHRFNLEVQQLASYRANRAQLRSDNRKTLAHQRERLKSPEIRAYVDAKLQQGWTPEIIAGRLILD
jgi:IS30 family transposase